MTKRDKIIIGSAALLAVLVIATALIAYLSPGAEGKQNAASLILLCGIVAVSVLSVVIVFLTKVRRKKHEKQLNMEYYRDYEVIRDAVINSQLSYGIKNEICGDVLDLLISAQESGKPAENAVGNPDAFAKDIVQSYSKPRYLAALGLIDAVIAFILYILGVTLITWLEHTDSSFYSARIGIDMVAFFGLIALVALPLTRRLASKSSGWAYLIPIAFGILFVLAAELLRKWAYGAEWVRTFLDGTIPMIPNAFVFAAYVLTLPLLLLLKNRLRKRMLRLRK